MPAGFLIDAVSIIGMIAGYKFKSKLLIKYSATASILSKLGLIGGGLFLDKKKKDLEKELDGGQDLRYLRGFLNSNIKK